MGNRSSRQSDPGDIRTSYYISPSGSEERVHITRSRSLPRPQRRNTRRSRHLRQRRSPNPATFLEQVLDDGPSPQLRRFLAATENYPQGPRRDGRLPEIIYTEHVNGVLDQNRKRNRGRTSHRHRLLFGRRSNRPSDDADETREYIDTSITMRGVSPSTRGLRSGDTYFDRPDSTGYRPMRVHNPTRDLDPSAPGRGM
ncbi:hypothetical protein A1O1_06615, partial [Capronia coronata CBS 617.96]